MFVLPEYFYEQERSDEEAEPTFSEDEAVTQKGLRRSQSVKITRSKGRKDVRGGACYYCVEAQNLQSDPVSVSRLVTDP